MSASTDLLSFAGHLVLLPLVTWRDAAMACPRRLPAVTEEALTKALSTEGLALDAWNVRDDVETAFCRFDCVEGHALLRVTGQRTHVHLVSERAALAVLVHDAMPQQAFSACYGAFDGCIPLATLHLH